MELEEKLETTFIYSLVDPREEDHIRYIGKSDHPNRRLLEHIQESFTNKRSRKISWIRKIIKQGVIPKLIVLREVLLQEWEYWERYYYDINKENNRLTNTRECGLGKAKHSGETIELLREISISRSKRGKEHHMYGKTLTEEHKQKLKEGRENNPTKPRVKIEQYNYQTNELINTFSSIKECSEELGIGIKKIQELLVGYRVVSKGVKKNVYSLKGFTFKRTS